MSKAVKASELKEGDRFALEGATHTVAVNMAWMGAVSCYADHTRTDESPTYRVAMPERDDTLVEAPNA